MQRQLTSNAFHQDRSTSIRRNRQSARAGSIMAPTLLTVFLVFAHAARICAENLTHLAVPPRETFRMSKTSLQTPAIEGLLARGLDPDSYECSESQRESHEAYILSVRRHSFPTDQLTKQPYFRQRPVQHV